MKSRLPFLFCLAILSSCCANAADTPVEGEIEPKKTDVAGGIYHNKTRKSLTNVTVTAYTSKKSKVVLSNANGNFSFDDLQPGTYKFVFERDGFKKVIKEKTIARADERQQLNVYMEEHVAFDFVPGPSHFFEF